MESKGPRVFFGGSCMMYPHLKLTASLHLKMEGLERRVTFPFGAISALFSGAIC